jgi:hypothetical protein
MGPRIRVWLGDDHAVMHHADASQTTGMDQRELEGVTDCGQPGRLTLVHGETVDTGKLCEGCMAVTGPNPALLGDSYGPV